MRIVTLGQETGREFCVHASDKALPGESFWSMAHKFCARNALSWPETIAAMSGGAVIDGAGLRLAARMDPRIAPRGGWLPRFIETIRGDADSIERGTIKGLSGRLLDQIDMDLLSVRNLRFCPKCIEGGHHSITSQFVFQANCAIHDVALQDKCPACSKEIPFKMPGTYEESFACPSCRAALWARRVAIRTDPKVEELAEQQLRNVSERLRGWERLGFEFGIRKRTKHGDQAGGRAWTEVHGVKMADYLDQMASGRSCSIPAQAKEGRAAEQGQDYHKELRTLIRPYYKSIARHLRKRVIKLGNKHVHRLCLADWRDRGFIDYREQFRAAEAPNEVYAYISWRMLWEIADSPARLLAGGASRDSTKNEPNGFRARDWDTSVAQQFATHFRLTWSKALNTPAKTQFDGRVFAMACLATFRHIAELYDQAPRVDEASAWQDIEMDRAVAPIFVLETGAARARLHWFTGQSCSAAA
jgi:hypothetical protein